MAEIDEILQYKQERGNLEDLYVVSVMKGETMFGHILVLHGETQVHAGALIARSISNPCE